MREKLVVLCVCVKSGRGCLALEGLRLYSIFAKEIRTEGLQKIENHLYFVSDINGKSNQIQLNKEPDSLKIRAVSNVS